MKKLLFAIAACLTSISIHANEMHHELDVTDIWVRATPPGVTTSAMYMLIKNPTEKTMTLTAISSVISDRIEIHNTVNKDGVMQMRQIEAIDIDPNGTAELKPHGKHIMFFDLKEALTPETKINVELVFQDGTKLTTEVPVLKNEASHNKHSDMKSNKHKDH